MALEPVTAQFYSANPVCKGLSEVSPAALDWFVEHGYDKAMGARPMARLVQSTLKAPLANEILFGKLTSGGTATVDVKDGQITIETAGPDATH